MKTIRPFVYAGVGILAFHTTFIGKNLYGAFPWLDMVMHLAGGAVVSLFISALFQKEIAYAKTAPQRTRTLLVVFFIMGGTAIVGIFWEFFEWGIDTFLIPNFMGTRNDTLLDLAMDMGGSLVGIAAGLLEKEQKK